MNKTFIAMLMSAVLASVSFTSFANHHEGGNHESEKHEMDADANKDGKISFEEFKAAREKHMEEHFKRRDTNHDGFIDESEKAAAKANWKKHHKMDKHGERCEMHDK
jgi:hypothetical protein